MTPALMFWFSLTTLFRIGIMVLVVYKLMTHIERFCFTERVGLGLMGGSAIMTIPVVWANDPTPFEGWTTAVFTFGVFLNLLGRTLRNLKHDRNNAEMARRAKAHFKQRAGQQ